MILATDDQRVAGIVILGTAPTAMKVLSKVPNLKPVLMRESRNYWLNPDSSGNTWTVSPLGRLCVIGPPDMTTLPHQASQEGQGTREYGEEALELRLKSFRTLRYRYERYQCGDASECLLSTTRKDLNGTYSPLHPPPPT